MKKRFVDVNPGDTLYELPKDIFLGDIIETLVVKYSYIIPVKLYNKYEYYLYIECKNKRKFLYNIQQWDRYKMYHSDYVIFTDKKSAIGYYKHSLKLRAKRIEREVEVYKKKQYGYYIAEKNAIKVLDDITEIVSKPLNLSDIIS